VSGPPSHWAERPAELSPGSQSRGLRSGSGGPAARRVRVAQRHEAWYLPSPSASSRTFGTRPSGLNGPRSSAPSGNPGGTSEI
jgi:hypothetical protein